MPRYLSKSPASPQSEMDPMVKQYMMDKYFTPEQNQSVGVPDISKGSNVGVEEGADEQDQMDEARKNSKMMGLFGAGMKGLAAMSPGALPQVFKKGWNETGAPQQTQTQSMEVDTSPLEKAGRRGEQQVIDDQKMADNKTQREDRDSARQQRDAGFAATAAKQDPASKESADARAYLKQIAPNATNMAGFEGMSAAQIEKIAPSIYSSYNDSEKRKQDAANLQLKKSEVSELRGQSRDAKEALAGEKMSEKMQALQTPYGPANSLDDAKQLKTAHESKLHFDNIINEMISLRTKHGGGTNSITNSEDVARGEQLSKDALLEYKNMAKLGVLSLSDEKILNAIIPKDPLAYNGLGATMTGQDPILNNLTKFKEDSDKDFSTRVSTRTRDGGAKYSNERKAPGETVSMVFPDGKTKKVPANQVDKFKGYGGKLVDDENTDIAMRH